MSAIALGRFLARRLAESGVGGPVTLDEVRRRLVPYGACRGELDLATKAEYDLSLLALLCEPELLDVPDEGLREEIRRELASPEPELGVLDGFGSVAVELGPGLGGRRRPGSRRREPPTSPAPAEEGSSATPGGAPVAEPGPVPVAEPGAGEEEPEAGAACRACEAELPSGREVRFCPFCGADQRLRRCDACGEELDPGWRYCPTCGRTADA